MDARSNKDRRQNDRRQKEVPCAVERRMAERRVKVNRRRQIDPTTCERDYSPEEVEFMGALDDYKRRSGRMFPTCSEILEVFIGLGYEKRTELPMVTLQEREHRYRRKPRKPCKSLLRKRPGIAIFPTDCGGLMRTAAPDRCNGTWLEARGTVGNNSPLTHCCDIGRRKPADGRRLHQLCRQ